MVWDVRNMGAGKLRKSKSMSGFANNLKAKTKTFIKFKIPLLTLG